MILAIQHTKPHRQIIRKPLHCSMALSNILGIRINIQRHAFSKKEHKICDSELEFGILCIYLQDKCALKRVGVLINLRSTTQLNTIGPWLKRPKLYTLCEKREREREKRSIHINTKSAKNPRPKNNAKQTISHLHFPSLFFLAFSKATTTKSHTLNTKKTHNVVI